MRVNKISKICAIILLTFFCVYMMISVNMESNATTSGISWNQYVDDNIKANCWYNFMDKGTEVLITVNDTSKSGNIIDDENGHPWKKKSSKIELVEIGNGIKTIGANSFSEMNSIKRVTVSTTCEIIKTGAFSNCTNLSIIKLKEGLKEIGEAAFAGCVSLEEVELPNTVEKINKRAFYGCTNLKSIKIPNTVESIGDSTFEKCDNLECIMVDESNEKLIQQLKVLGYENKIMIIKDNYNILYGDVNLNGSVDIADVIYLIGNRTVGKGGPLSDAQKLVANCYDDDKINAIDELVLFKYILGIEKILPVYYSDDKQDSIAEKINDEFYNTFIRKKYNKFEFSDIAKLIHKEIRQRALTEKGIMQYTDQNIEIKNIYRDGKFGENINENGYIGLCLYEYGIYTGNESLINYVTECQGKIYDITENKLNELGWQKIEYTSEEQLQNGDIIITPKKSQIYIENGIYSCESDAMIKEINLSKPIEPGDEKYIIRIEPKSGEDETLKWELDENILEIEVNGECDENTIPWKASKNNISTYKIKVNSTNLDTAIKLVRSTTENSKSVSTKTLILTTNDLVSAVSKIKNEMLLGYHTEDESYIEILNNNEYKISTVLKFDQFYKEHINGNLENGDTFYDICKNVKEVIAEKSQNGSMTYNDSIGICIPDDIYKGEYADCSSYVSMCLYEYGIHTGNRELVKFVNGYRKKAVEMTGGINLLRTRRTNNSKAISRFRFK